MFKIHLTISTRKYKFREFLQENKNLGKPELCLINKKK